MPGLLRSIFGVLNRDLTGKTWEVRKTHPYFGEMVYFGSKDPAACYWEAGLAAPNQSEPISVTMRGTQAGPEPSEEAFCKAVLSDVDTLFKRCQTAFEPIFAMWTKQPFPSAWRDGFTLDGFEVPPEGNADGQWHVCYFVEPTGRYFTAHFLKGEVSDVQVDG